MDCGIARDLSIGKEKSKPPLRSISLKVVLLEFCQWHPSECDLNLAPEWGAAFCVDKSRDKMWLISQQKV
jgi:hypothetical protein